MLHVSVREDRKQSAPADGTAVGVHLASVRTVVREDEKATQHVTFQGERKGTAARHKRGSSYVCARVATQRNHARGFVRAGCRDAYYYTVVGVNMSR